MSQTCISGIESSLREKWRLLKSKLEEANKGTTNGKDITLGFFPSTTKSDQLLWPSGVLQVKYFIVLLLQLILYSSLTGPKHSIVTCLEYLAVSAALHVNKLHTMNINTHIKFSNLSLVLCPQSFPIIIIFV